MALFSIKKKVTVKKYSMFQLLTVGQKEFEICNTFLYVIIKRYLEDAVKRKKWENFYSSANQRHYL